MGDIPLHGWGEGLIHGDNVTKGFFSCSKEAIEEGSLFVGSQLRNTLRYR
jgi:hypothetical protein